MAPVVASHASIKHYQVIQDAGGRSPSLAEAEAVEQIVGNDAYRPRWGTLDHPHPTILQSGPHGGSGELRDRQTLIRRKFTIAELKRICGFPDDFVLTGTYAQQWERLGRAVPPLMMKAIADTIRDEVLIRCVESSARS
jgi:site-specific DNA-cytosine methylase